MAQFFNQRLRFLKINRLESFSEPVKVADGVFRLPQAGHCCSSFPPHDWQNRAPADCLCDTVDTVGASFLRG
jgi:hypothetical protein